MSLNNLYRLPDEGYVAGVCAGLARRFDWNVWALRAVCMLMLYFFAKFAAISYILASIFFKKRYKSDATMRPEESALGNLQEEFNQLRERLQR
ncbi:MAG: PspC domain-containing protein [Xanthomonadales bacterium]|nr:PspC domain-containing protein [Xanthomonadales bacterium]